MSFRMEAEPPRRDPWRVPAVSPGQSVRSAASAFSG